MQSRMLQSAASALLPVSSVFSTTLYTGTGTTQTITNGIDLASNGGLVWIKQRSGTQDHTIFDTARGVNNYLRSNSTGAQNPGGSYTDLLTAFNSSGFTLGADASTAGFTNNSGAFASWTFRKAPKFFDVVTYTGDGATDQILTHSLGVQPCMVVIKATSASSTNWIVQHISLQAIRYYLKLNTSDFFTQTASAPSAISWANTTEFVVHGGWPTGSGNDLNASGVSYVAYLFAHDTTSTGIIKGGTFTTDGSGSGSFDPGWAQGVQFIMLKSVAFTGDWEIYDTQRTPAWSSSDARLRPNLFAAEDAVTRLSASGTALNFTNLNANDTYIYMIVAAP